MEFFLPVLTTIGFTVLVFSLWNFISVKKHLKRTGNDFSRVSNLADEKYYELKSKQEFIIAVATILFALITFLGYSTIDNIKVKLNEQFQNEKDSIKILYNTANKQIQEQKEQVIMSSRQIQEQTDKVNSLNNIANNNYKRLIKTGLSYQDSVTAALSMVSVLKKNVSIINSKDIISQNIYIVDPVFVEAFSHDIAGKYKGYRFVRFTKLTTILGKRLPDFKVPPSIIIFSNYLKDIELGEIGIDGFYIKCDLDITFNLWISQKPEGINYPPIINAGDDTIIYLKSK